MQNFEMTDLRRSAAEMDALSVLFPPLHVAVIGNDALVRTGFISHISPSDLRLIDSEPADQSSLPNTHEESSNFSRHRLIISDSGGTRTYYKASLARESGLIEPEMLSLLWQNISTVEKFEVDTVSLEAALLRTGSKTDWLVFEHFGAAKILEKTDPLPSDLDVIVARTIERANSADIAKTFNDVSLQRAMKKKGYLLYSKAPARHPQTSYSVFVRDWRALYKSEIPQLTKHSEELKQSLSECEQKSEESIESLKNELVTAEKNCALAQERQVIAESNLSDLEVKYKKMAEEKLRHEKQLQEVQHHLSAAIHQLEDEGDTPSSDAVGEKKSPQSQKSAARKDT